MSKKFKPLADRVLIQPAPVEMKTASGIIIPDSAKEKPLIGEIIAVGKGKVEVWFTEPLAELLNDDVEVIAMDNSNQGINTIKDIKEHISDIKQKT